MMRKKLIWGIPAAAALLLVGGAVCWFWLAADTPEVAQATAQENRAAHDALREALLTVTRDNAAKSVALLRGVQDTFTADATAAKYAQQWGEVRALSAMWYLCRTADDAAVRSLPLAAEIERIGQELKAERVRLHADGVDVYGSVAMKKAFSGGVRPEAPDVESMEALLRETTAVMLKMAAAAQEQGAAALPAFYAECVRLRVRWSILQEYGGVVRTAAEQVCRDAESEVRKACIPLTELFLKDTGDARVAIAVRLLPPLKLAVDESLASGELAAPVKELVQLAGEMNAALKSVADKQSAEAAVVPLARANKRYAEVYRACSSTLIRLEPDFMPELSELADLLAENDRMALQLMALTPSCFGCEELAELLESWHKV